MEPPLEGGIARNDPVATGTSKAGMTAKDSESCLFCVRPTKGPCYDGTYRPPSWLAGWHSTFSRRDIRPDSPASWPLSTQLSVRLPLASSGILQVTFICHGR